MRKRARRIFYIFEKKKKGEELTMAGTRTRHPHASSGAVISEAARASSSSNETTRGGPTGP
jgi:hypothetical protein